MTVGPLPRPAPTAEDSDGPHGPLARWAVALSAGFGMLFAAAVAAVAIGGFGGALAAIAFAGSLAAFVLAIAAKVTDEYWAWLWLPLGMFPAMIVFLVLGEAFWWE